jgi:hypothetical protein
LKYLVYLLLCLNAAYFVWNQTQPPRALPVLQVPPLPSEVESLALLSERTRENPVANELVMKPDEAREVVDTEPDPDPAPVIPEEGNDSAAVVVEMPSVCRTIGPIKANKGASALLNQLSRQGYPATLRESEIQAPSGYQVYLPEMSSKKAREVVSALKAADMNDYFVGKRNHISLGIFSGKSKAQVRQQKVRQLGYDAVLDPRYKIRKAYWIDIEENDRTLEGPEGWQRIMSAYPEIPVQKVSCE